MSRRPGGTMRGEMGTFRVDIELENPAGPGVTRVLAGVLVDTGPELSRVPAEVLESLGVARNNRWRFRQADGTVLERWTGSVLVRVLGKHAADEVVFGEPGSRKSQENVTSIMIPSSWFDLRRGN